MLCMIASCVGDSCVQHALQAAGTSDKHRATVF